MANILMVLDEKMVEVNWQWVTNIHMMLDEEMDDGELTMSDQYTHDAKYKKWDHAELTMSDQHEYTWC